MDDMQHTQIGQKIETDPINVKQIEEPINIEEEMEEAFEETEVEDTTIEEDISDSLLEDDITENEEDFLKMGDDEEDYDDLEGDDTENEFKFSIPIATEKIETLRAWLEEEERKLQDSPELARMVSDDDNHYLRKLTNMFANTNAADEFFREAWNKQKDYTKVSDKYTQDDIVLKGTTPISRKNRNGAMVSGSDARMLVKLSDRDIRRDYLYNSGFPIILHGPSSRELNQYYSDAHDNAESFGKMFGVHFYLFHDIDSKKSGMELIERLTHKCGVKDWDRSKNLRKALSIHDYFTCLWIIGSLMYKDGFDHEFICTNQNKQCGYSEITKVDLKELRLINFGALKEDHLKHLADTKVKGQKTLSQYRDSLFEEEKFKLYGNWVAIPKVPTMYEYIEYGETFKAELIRNVQINNKDELSKYLLFNFYRNFVPWIKEVRYMNTDGSINFRTDNVEAIEDLMDINKLEKSEFAKEMTDYMQRTMIGFIGHKTNGCPKCGYMPSEANNGFVAFDPQSHFFTLTVAKLNQLV